jgi:hypothetical protein
VIQRNLSLLLLALASAQVALAEDLEPGVQTSTAAAPAPVAAPRESGTATLPTRPAAPGRAPSPSPTAAARPGAKASPAGTPHVLDRIELDATQITGNRELPNVMYVVPWKKPDLGDFAGRPPKSLLDEVLAPVDRDVFRRQNRYFTALQPDRAAPGAPPAGAAPQSGAAGTATPPAAAGDEK